MARQHVEIYLGASLFLKWRCRYFGEVDEFLYEPVVVSTQGLGSGLELWAREQTLDASIGIFSRPDVEACHDRQYEVRFQLLVQP